MKLLKLSLFLLFLSSLNVYSQGQNKIAKSELEYKIDKRSQMEREHRDTDLDGIGLADIVEVLKSQHIEINKFKIGKFDKRYKMQLVADEYLNGKIISSKVVANMSNTYTHFESDKPFYDFIDQLTIITNYNPKEKETKLNIKTYAFEMSNFLVMKNTEKDSGLYWRRYTDTNWELNKKVPLLICASSWFDPEINMHRFCGVNTLKVNDAGTNELLNKSPNYVIYSLLVSE